MHASTMTLLLLINCIFGTIALAIGFIAGGWFLSGKRSEAAPAPSPTPPAPQQDPQSLERALIASGRLRELATSMASDVDEHNTRVEQITNELRSIHPGDAAAAEAGFLRAMAQVAAASEELQQRLAKAELQIQAQAQEIRSHESDARTDSLTQLANRRAFDLELDRRFAEWQRKQTTFSLALLDIDHFKKLNDAHGHQAGDEVLKQVAATIKNVAREMDLPCRYGGEEFAIVMPNTGGHDAGLAAERVRHAVEAVTIEVEGKSLRVTTSIGVAEISVVSSPMQLTKRADEALYQSKQAGRNCTHLFDGRRFTPVTPGVKASPESLSEPAITSTLDCLPNRTLFADELRRRVAEAHRTGKPLAVLAVEVQGYRDFKRQHGCAAAHTTLESVAKFLASTLREMDLLGRLDDGQFGIMLPGSTPEDAQLVGDRARKALVNCTAHLSENESGLTVRVGASVAGPDDTAASLIERAEGQVEDYTEAPIEAATIA